jgi:hypothetical protein
MRKITLNRLVLLALLCASVFLATSAPQPAQADFTTASCASIGCGSWQYYGCCLSHLYQRRTCCDGPTCCTQYRCTTSPCIF